MAAIPKLGREPHFRAARQSGAIEHEPYDEGMFLLGLQAAAWRVPFLPTRVGLGSDLLRDNPPNPGYDPAKDLAHVAILGTIPLALIVPVDSPAKSVADVVKSARDKPGVLNFSSSGNATPSHLMLERFKLSARVQITHVPYKGSAPALNDIMAGRIDGTIDSMPALLAQIKAGKVRALAVSGRERAAQLPDVPTLAEAGLPDLVVNTWFGIAAPAATPGEIVQRLNQEILLAVQSPEVKTRFDELSFAPAPMSAAETQRFIQAEIERWKPVVAASGISFQ